MADHRAAADLERRVGREAGREIEAALAIDSDVVAQDDIAAAADVMDEDVGVDISATALAQAIGSAPELGMTSYSRRRL